MSRRSKAISPNENGAKKGCEAHLDDGPGGLFRPRYRGHANGHYALRFNAIALVVASLACQVNATPSTLPTGGQVVSGKGELLGSANGLVITQQSKRLTLDWQQFNIGAGRSVEFVQPSSSAVAINRVLGSEVSTIQGSLKANGQVFLLNPNGVWFTPTAQVNVGGLVASTLNLQSDDIATGRYVFNGRSQAAVINQGSITTTPGGSVALLAAKVINDGQIHAPAGRVALGAGSRITLDLGGPTLLQVGNEDLETLISNGGAIRAEGGLVWLSAKGADTLAHSVINHSGVIEAQALQGGEGGSVMLLAKDGTLNLSGSITAEASLVETSGRHFNAAPSASVRARQWLIDPINVDIDSALAASISAALASGNVTIATTGSCTGVSCTGSGADGNITVSSPVAWSSNRSLTLQADNNIGVNAALTHTGTSAGGIVFLYGQAAADGGSSTYAATAAVTSPSLQWRKGSDAASTRYAIHDGNYFLGNKYMELGICGSASVACSSGSSGGKFGTTNKPSLFFGRSSGSGIGMVGDADGFGSGIDLRIDYFLPGSPAEQFTAGYSISGAATSALNFANSGNSPVFEFLPVASNNKITLKYSTVLNSKLKVEQQISLTGNNKYFRLDVALTNVSSGNLDNVQFARSFDPDNSVDKDGGGGYNTVNKIEQTLAAGDSANAVSASSQSSGSYYTAAGTTAKIVYFSTDADSKPGYGSAFFSGSSLSSMTSAANALSKGNSQSADIGIGMLFNAGTMTPGQSKNYALSASLDNRSIADILADLNSAVAVTSLNYTLGNASTSPLYKGSAYNLADQWSASAIFGGSYSAWVPGTDYVFVFNGGTVTGFTNAGTYTNLGINILRSGYQSAASGNTAGSFTITPAPLTVTANNKSKTYDGQAFSGGNGVSYSGFVNGESSAVLSGSLGFTGNSQGAVNAGSYVISPQGLSSSNYTINHVAGDLTITPRPITVLADPKSKTYGNADPALTWSVTGGELVGSDTLNGALSRAPGANVGSYAIDASTLSNGNYLITARNGVLTINPRPITVLADAKSKTYGNADPALSWSVTAGELIGSDTLSGALSRAPGANVGSYPIDASALSNGNYLITAQNGVLTINPRPITVRADPKSKTYGMVDPALTWSLSSGDLVGGDTLAGNLFRQAGEAVGNFSIDASALFNSNYLITALNGNLQISPQAPISRPPADAPPPMPTAALGGGVVFVPDGAAPVVSRMVQVMVQTADQRAPQQALNQLVPELSGSGVRTPSLADLVQQSRVLDERRSKAAGATEP
ncbi:MBG domain-containing protein [Paucibacter sp. KCTC 42545]|uniref:MBG domain-containing protein n=1 Tax=Paucibacter sp. KCTC 42545 TaxID=1768242 RepID=UPI000733B35C|nr:MBG domain-containing protein [Paucibacter sp. KCTC 42545]ALT78851.1 hypothetical protein AT984_18325 [Paucibacter sp. KCTC 42545]